MTSACVKLHAKCISIRDGSRIWIYGGLVERRTHKNRLWGLGIIRDLSPTGPQNRRLCEQENWAIAKMTARCAIGYSTLILPLIVWVYLRLFFSGGLRKTYFCKSDVSAVHGHPRSLILAPIESAYATSY